MAHHARQLCCSLWRLVFVRGLKKERAVFRREDSCQVTCINVVNLGRHHNGLSPHVPGSQYHHRLRTGRIAPPLPALGFILVHGGESHVKTRPYLKIGLCKLSTLENWKTGRQEQRGFVRWRESRVARHTLRNVLRCADHFWETGTCVWMHPNTSRSNEIQIPRKPLTVNELPEA